MPLSKKELACLILLTTIIAATSCSKRDDASLNELNGTWVETSRDENLSSTAYILDDDTTDAYLSYKSKSTLRYDGDSINGTENYTTYSNKGNTSTSKPQKTIRGISNIQVTFNKKDGTFEINETTKQTTSYTEVSTYTYSYTYSVDSTVNVLVTTTIETKNTDNYTRIQKGNFYLNEKIADQRKGTKLFLDFTSDETTGILSTDSVTTIKQAGFPDSTRTDKTTQKYSTIRTRNGTAIYSITEATRKKLNLQFEGTGESVEKRVYMRDGNADSTIMESIETKGVICLGFKKQ